MPLIQWRKIGTLGCLFFVCALVYSVGLDSPYLLDDVANIPQALSANWQDVIFRTFTNESGLLPRLIPQFSFAVQSLYSSSPYVTHVLNLIIHLLVSLAIYGLIRRVHKSSALFVTAVFLLHPLFVSTVLYGVGRITQLSALFMLITLNKYIDWRSGRAHWTWFAVSFILALLCKENAVVVLPIIWLWEYLHNNKNHYLILSPLIASALIGTMLVMDVNEFIRHGFGPVDRIWLQGGALLHYLQWIIIPWFDSLTFYQDHLIFMTNIWCFIGWVVTIVLTIALFIPQISIPVRFGIGIFIIGHSLEASFVPLEIAFEHRNYFPAIGIFLCAGYYLRNISIKLIIVLVFTTMTLLRAHSFAEGFAAQSIANAPQSARAYLALAANQEQPEIIFGLAEAAKDHTFDKVGITFYQWQILCDRLHPARIEEGLANASGIITSFGASSISQYLSMVAAGTCQIDSKTLDKLDTILQNNRTISNHARMLINWRFAQAWGYKGELNKMYQHFEQAISYSNSQFAWLNYLQTLHSLDDPMFEKMLISYEKRFIIAPDAKFIKDNYVNFDPSSSQ